MTLYTLQDACEHLRRTPDEIRALLAASQTPNGDCIEWRKNLDSAGYGQLVTWTQGERRRISVHRLTYLLHNGPIPSDLCVMHICDNPCCANPHHLVVGSRHANMQDMKRKGRSMNGSASPRSKLTDDCAARIRAMGARGLEHRQIAAEFGVSRSTITKIINGTAYRQEALADE